MSVSRLKLEIKFLRKKTFLSGIFKIADENLIRRQSTLACDQMFFECLNVLRVGEFVECGANDAYASKTVVKQGLRAVAIEANPITFAQLTEPNSEGVITVNKGLSDRSGKLEFYVPQDNSIAGSATFIPQKGIDYDVQKIDVVPLDEVLGQVGFGNKCNALWIDVEGFQEKVLAGADNYLRNANLKIIKIELENKSFFEGQLLSEQVDNIFYKYGFLPVFCDLQFGLQFNAIYVRKICIDEVITEIEKAYQTVRESHLGVKNMITKTKLRWYLSDFIKIFEIKTGVDLNGIVKRIRVFLKKF
jgi:FkbM family methyltransferase